MVAYTADNASANYGKIRSVFQKLRLLLPNMIKGNCHCHTVHNAVRHSQKLVSNDVESFVLEVYHAYSLSQILLMLKNALNIFDALKVYF